MTGGPIIPAVVPADRDAVSSGLDPCVGTLAAEFSALWTDTPAETPSLGRRVGRYRQFGNARAIARLLDELGGEVERLDGRQPPPAWRTRVQDRIQRFGCQRLGWPDGYRQLPFGPAFYESTVAFTEAARAFDPRMSPDDLWQALRNVWIGNSLQMLLNQPLDAGPALCAYSLLYPVTDNWIDDPEVPTDRKRTFNERLTRRLAGEAPSPADAHEATVHHLIERIEASRPRGLYPALYAALLAIQHGQVRSLAQNVRRGARALPDGELLAISVEKGGSSVLVDLHLVADVPTTEDERFAFGYGVALQLLDDLQDVDDDLAVGHETLFTRAARQGTLDVMTARLTAFVDAVLATSVADGSARADAYRDLVRRNCRTLLVSCVADAPCRFSRRFRRHLTTEWPISLRAQRRLRRRATAWWGRLAPA